VHSFATLWLIGNLPDYPDPNVADSGPARSVGETARYFHPIRVTGHRA
jgi:hypothetical protein